MNDFLAWLTSGWSDGSLRVLQLSSAGLLVLAVLCCAWLNQAVGDLRVSRSEEAKRQAAAQHAEVLAAEQAEAARKAAQAAQRIELLEGMARVAEGETRASQLQAAAARAEAREAAVRAQMLVQQHVWRNVTPEQDATLRRMLKATSKHPLELIFAPDDPEQAHFARALGTVLEQSGYVVTFGALAPGGGEPVPGLEFVVRNGAPYPTNAPNLEEAFREAGLEAIWSGVEDPARPTESIQLFVGRKP